jgi:hypothetical protein
LTRIADLRRAIRAHAVAAVSGGSGLRQEQHQGQNDDGEARHDWKNEARRKKKMFSLARFLELYLLWVLESTEVPRTTGTTQTDPGFG